PGLQNGEVLTARAHQRRADTIALDQYQALEETADIVIFIFFAGVTRRGERRQSDLLGGTVVGALQPQPFAQRGAGIVTGHGVDLHDALAAILGKRRHRLGDGCSLAGEPDDIARCDAREAHVGRIETGKATTDVLRQGLGRFAHQIARNRLCHCPAVLRHHCLAASIIATLQTAGPLPRTAVASWRCSIAELSLSRVAVSSKSPRSSRKERSSSCRPKWALSSSIRCSSRSNASPWRSMSSSLKCPPSTRRMAWRSIIDAASRPEREPAARDRRLCFRRRWRDGSAQAAS